MSEFSYQICVKKGVTGPQSANCLAASYDRISKHGCVRPETYEEYEDLRHDFVKNYGDDTTYVDHEAVKRYHEVRQKIRAELGVMTPRNIVEARVNTEQELSDQIGKLLVGGFRPAVYLDTGGLHAVGVAGEVEEGYFDVRSTWTPFTDRVVALPDLYSYLSLPPRIRARATGRKSYKQFNVIALPPEPN